MRLHKYLKSIILIALLLIYPVSMAIPYNVHAQDSNPKVVKVGWFDSSYNYFDQAGRRDGYSYEYQQKLSAYNGWTYEYIVGSWSDLLQMLKDGEIDLLSDVSYVPDREAYMFYPSLPMGAEEYYLFTAPKNEVISPSDVSTLNGKKIGVNKGSVQADLYAEWAKENGIEAETVEVNCSEDESLKMLETGVLDAYVTVDAFMDPSQAVPVYKIGSSDYYFAVAKNRPDLLEDLNYAMSQIQDEDRYYNSKMYEKYIRKAGANTFASSDLTDWLVEHGPIRVGYQDNYMAFCAADEKTGELKGVLKDFLKLASTCIQNVQIDFETIAYPTAEDAMEALKKGEVDCVFPANLSSYESETQGIVMTPAILNTEMHAVVRMTDPDLFAPDRKVIVAINEGNPNYEEFLREYFPTWEKKYYPTSQDCLKGIARGEADCLIISNYRYNNIARLCDKYNLTSFSTGIGMDYCLAIEKGQTELYTILSKITSLIPDASLNAALARYITEDATRTFMDYLQDHLLLVMAVITIVLLVVLILLVQNIRSGKKAKRLISATELDDLTGLYNRKYFFQYADQMYKGNSVIPRDAFVINIEQFHSINALHGRKVGDQVLRAIGNELAAIAKEMKGIGGRFEADSFDLYCHHTQDYQSIFDRLQESLNAVVPNANIRLRMGVMPWQEGVDPVHLFDRALTACNMARGHYKEHLIVYDENVSKRENYEQRLINDLPHGLETGEFEVYYQPKYDIQSEPARLASVEALVRWRHKELGMVSPGDFIPLFERNGQIRLLDQYVWKEAARTIAGWRDIYGVVIPVSVNLSRIDIFDPDLEETLEEILDRNVLEHKDFKLEVTESAYTENADQLIRVVENLRGKGFEIEMDDFGSGYSSLNMLSEMPIDALKMDMEFVRNIDRDEKNRLMVGLILDIAENLSIPVIAEGVETETQLILLKNLGCAMVQGYYFSRPLPAEEFERQYLSGSSQK